MNADSHFGGLLCSLRAKIVYVLLAACACCVLLYAGGNTLVNRLVETYYLSDYAVEQRTLRELERFQTLVRNENLASTDTQRLISWTAQEKYTYLIFYDGTRYLYEIGWGSMFEDGDSEDYYTEPDYAHCRVQFSDRTLNMVLLDFSEYHLYDLSGLVLLILCGLIFLLFFLLYTTFFTKRVIVLSEKVNTLGAGQLEIPIQASGHDELSRLTQDVEQMRQSILAQIQSEEAAWKANSDLITAISHDIRTPLTALLGYLDLAVGQQYQTPAQLTQYLQVSQEKAMQLKGLTDELFQYFLVFGKENPNMELQPYDAPVLLQQLLGEHSIDLQMNGFQCTEKPLTDACELLTDISYIQRVLDNLFGNIKKHADVTKPVRIYSDRKGDFVHIFLMNEIPEMPNAVESTHIGLKTCEKIMAQLKGDFSVEQDDHRFSVEITIPCRDKAP